MQGHQLNNSITNHPGRLSPSLFLDYEAQCRPVTSYQDLKDAFLNTDDFLGCMAAQQVFQRVEEVVEEMVQDVLLHGSDKHLETSSVDQDAAMMLLQLKR